MKVNSPLPPTHPLINPTNQSPSCLTKLFKCTIEPFVGSIIKISLYRSAYLREGFSKWIVLPIVRKIGNCWLEAENLPAMFTSFDKKRLDDTEASLLQIGEKTILKVDEERSIPFVHFQKDKNNRSTCVLYLNGFGLPYQTAKNFIHKHLDEDFDFAVFEWGNKVSMQGFVEDAEAAYQALIEKGYQPNQIKVLGYCGTTYVATYLKAKHHQEGLDAILVDPHTSFREVVDQANPIGKYGVGAIATEEYDLDNINTLSHLKHTGASTCLVIDPENLITPPDTVERLQNALAQSGVTTIRTQGKMNKQFNTPEIWNQYIQFLRRDQLQQEEMKEQDL